MIDWAQAAPGLEQLFASLAFGTLPAGFKASWEGRPQGFIKTPESTSLELKVRSIQDIGEDETRKIITKVNGVDTDVYAQLGNRRVILSVKVESYRNTNALWCFSTIERIRTRLRRPSSLAALDAINFALVNTGPSVPVPTARANREWSVASMDVTFGTRFEDAENAAFGWISTVIVTPQAQGTDGATLPDAINKEQTIGPV